MPYGERSGIAFDRAIVTWLELELSASNEVYGVVGPPVIARPVVVVKWRVAALGWLTMASGN